MRLALVLRGLAYAVMIVSGGLFIGFAMAFYLESLVGY